MTRSPTAVVIIAALATIGAAVTLTAPTGCALLSAQPTSERVYFEAQEAFIAVVTTAIDAKRAGKISQDAWNDTWNPAIQEGNAILERMDETWAMTNELAAARAAGDDGRAADLESQLASRTTMDTLRGLLMGVIARMEAARDG